MKQILWFRRDLRIQDNALLHYANGEVLPIFIFDQNILKKLPKEDKRVTFLYQRVMEFKKELQSIGLDLAIFYDYPTNVFQHLSRHYDHVLCSCDFDHYAITRDKEVETLIPMQRFYDSFFLHPKEVMKKDGTPYKVFTPFYNSFRPLWESEQITLMQPSKTLTLHSFHYDIVPTLQAIGFEEQTLPSFLYDDVTTLIETFKEKLDLYQHDRDYFAKDATSNLSVHLRFGVISPIQLFNHLKPLKNSTFFIRELFWREFYHYILYHFPTSETKNFNGKQLEYNDNTTWFQAWCDGRTGVPIIDAAMRHLNQTGLMHNRLRMITASFLTKNLFLPWQWGEAYFARKLLDYEKSSNVGSWQWGASTGADSVPYFRVFNPYTQSKKFDPQGKFIRSVLNELADVPTTKLHEENGVQSIVPHYPLPLVSIKHSRQEAIAKFKNA
jgi:deoxyribodipyrimidine photo-lyase